jgi:hypothetical protein
LFSAPSASLAEDPAGPLGTLGTLASSLLATGGSGGLDDVVARSVGLGYRVIDEYIQQGERAARGLGDRSYGLAGMMGDPQRLAMAGLGGDPQLVAARFAQYASEMASLWLGFAGLAGGGGMNGFPMTAPAAPPASRPAAANGAGAPPPASADEAAAPQRWTTARVAITSTRRTEVAVDLRLDGATGPIVAQALRAPSGNGLRIDDVAAEVGDDGTLIVRIDVPDHQAAGLYEGALVDEASSRTVGWVTLRVPEP